MTVDRVWCCFAFLVCIRHMYVFARCSLVGLESVNHVIGPTKQRKPLRYASSESRCQHVDDDDGN